MSELVVPGTETAAEKARRINVALSPEVERILREVSERTGISMADLRKAIEESPQVAAAETQALRFRYDEWWERQRDAEDIFGRKEG
jgi:hypothetical protein